MAFTYANNFEELDELGAGGFGQVYKVKDKIDEQFYAVKKITDKDSNKIKEVLREAQTLAKLSGDRVVRYMHCWVEMNTVFIKMELCSGNLKNLIGKKPGYFCRSISEPIDILEYSISCQIFRELLECVQYLHESIPPIIHRDLKPQNILMSRNHKNRNCLKICDFGLATFHDMTSMYHSNGVGTFAYLAPEVAKPRSKYNIKADIFSLGKIVEELFEIDINESTNNWNSYLNEKLNNLSELIISMTETIFARRPTCADIISNLGKYTIGIRELKNHPGLETITKNLLENVPENSIFCDYLDQVLSIQEAIAPSPAPRSIRPMPNVVPNNEVEYFSNVERNVIEQNDMDGPQPNQNDPQPELENEAKETVNKVSRELSHIGKQTRNFFKKL